MSHRALAGHLFVPSHLAQDPFSYTSVGLATTQTFGLGVYYTGVPELAAGIEIDWRLGRIATQQVASFTSAWINLRYYWNGT